MVTLAPRISHRVFESIVRHDSLDHPIAETYRRVATEAADKGLTRPSYQRVRELVHESRRIRRANRGPSAGEILWAIAAPYAGRKDLIRRLELFGIAPTTD